MKTLMTLLATASLVSLTACASIVSGSSQKVQVSTNPPSQSTCTVNNKIGSSTMVTPSQTNVSRSKSNLMVNCSDRATGSSGSQEVESSLEPWFLGNIIFGGIIGAPIDFATGAAWQYPSEVTIPLKSAYAPGAYNSQPASGAYGQPTAAAAAAVAPAAGAPTYAAPNYPQQQPASSTTYYAPAGTPAAQPAPQQYNYIPPSQLGTTAPRY